MSAGTISEPPRGAPVVDPTSPIPGADPVVRGGRFPALDGLRAVAVLAVIATHIGFQTGAINTGTLGAVLARGDIGVTFFFLISGFLLYSPFVRGHLAGTSVPAWRPFLRNRALRILPAYWVLLAVVLSTTDRSVLTPLRVVTHVLLLQVYPRSNLLGDLTQTWSLAVEATFYLALPLLAAVVAPRRRRTALQQVRVEGFLLAAMVIISLAWTVVVREDVIDQRVGGLWLPQYLDWFALGMTFAVLRAWHDRGGAVRLMDELGDAAGTCWLVAGLLFWLTTTPLAGPRTLDPPTTWEALVKHVLYGLAAFALLLPAIFGQDRNSLIRRLLVSRPARHLGRISYGLFLWNVLALDLVYRWTPLDPFRGDALLVTSLVLPLSVGLSELSLRLVEDRALQWKRSTVRPPQQPVPATPGTAAG